MTSASVENGSPIDATQSSKVRFGSPWIVWMDLPAARYSSRHAVSCCLPLSNSSCAKAPKEWPASLEGARVDLVLERE